MKVFPARNADSASNRLSTLLLYSESNCIPSGRDASSTKAFQLAEQIRTQLSPQSILLGPTPGAILRIKNRYYYQLIIKYKNEPKLQATLEDILQVSQKDQRQGLLIAIDNEPMYFI